MGEINKIKDLSSGEYTVKSYESKNGKYGITYVVEIIDQNNKEYFIWSNSYLTDYISTKSPNKKFKITIDNNMIEVIGYSRNVILN